MHRLLALLTAALPALGLAQPAPGEPAAPPRPPAPSAARAPARLIQEIDAAWARRDEPAQLAEQGALLEEALRAAPDDYDALWREARRYFWLADDPKLDAKEKSRYGKLGWEYGDRATAASPGRVEGWHYAAAGVGSYGLGLGVIAALRQGLEKEFTERLAKAEEIDPDFESGGIQTAWGRYFYELPWPKYSPGKARQSLETALRKNPSNVRAHVYLADLAKKEDQQEEARAELMRALAEPPGRYDAPEERRWQEVARDRLAQL